MKHCLFRFFRRPSIETLEPRRLLAVDHVVHISVDGLASQWLESILRDEALSPTGDFATFQRLQEEGASTFNARTDFTHANTLPNHATMLTGRPVLPPVGRAATAAHLWTDNTDPAVGATLHNNHPSLNYVPSVFDVVHDHGLSTAAFVSKSKFSLFDTSYDAVNGAIDVNPIGGDNGQDKIDVYVSRGDTQTLVDQFVDALSENLFTYSFLHLLDPDAAGHQFGWGSDPWEESVKQTGRQIGQVLDVVANHTSLKDRTAVIVTTDHGGIGTSHWNSAQAANYRIPFYVWGPGFEPGSNLYAHFAGKVSDPGFGRPNYSVVTQPIRNGDSANLALDLLQLPPIEGSSINRLHSCADRSANSCSPPPPGPVELFDLGDAPTPFPTLIASDGAIHRIEPGIYLGNGVDAEADGLIHAMAQGDDVARDDEDGVEFVSAIMPGELAEVTVIASAEGLLQAWFDWNGDGDWNDAGEQALVNQPLLVGANALSLRVPADAQPGLSFARFRFALQPDLLPTGLADSGEVEDHSFRISEAPDVGQVIARDDAFVIRTGASQFTLTVLTNDRGNGALTVTDMTEPSQGGSVQLGTNGATILYTPPDAFLGVETFAYQVRDEQGNLAEANVTVDVRPKVARDDAKVGLRLETTSLSGEPISSVAQDESFLLSVYVRDMRTAGRGVAQAHVDVVFTGDLTSAGDIEFGSGFPQNRSGRVDQAVIDEVGGSSSSTSGVDEQLLFQVPVQATRTGTFEFSIEEPDQDGHFVRLHGQPNPLPFDAWVMNPIQLEVLSPPPPPDPRDVDGNGFVTPLDALLVINDLNQFGPRRLEDIPPVDHGLDVNGDGFVAAIDALLVINLLNGHQSANTLAGAAAVPPTDRSVPVSQPTPIDPSRLQDQARQFVFRTMGDDRHSLEQVLFGASLPLDFDLWEKVASAI